jgi:FkbH-like protein
MVSDNLNYLALTREAKSINLEGLKKVRLAILADFATQQLETLLTVLAARSGIAFEFYKPGYDSIAFEILNEDSGLYEFKPQVVAILPAMQHLKARLLTSAERAATAAEITESYASYWTLLQQRSNATIIQGNFVTPLERAFGHYEHMASDSIGSLFAKINHEIVDRARKATGVLLFDMNHVASAVGLRAFVDERLWSLAKAPCRLEHLPVLAKELLDVIRARSGIVVKCVVLDLDNTIWGGVIGDDGLPGIALGDFDEGEAFVAFQSYLKELKRRGIILAVASKNEPEHALLPFREHPRMVLKEDDISVFVANWEPKPDNIRVIQQTLNIGMDSIVFLDDNPMERDLVRQFIPELIVPDMPEDPALYVQALAALNLFETASYSEADRQRPGQYREEAQRRISQAQFTDIQEYLRSLKMVITLERFNEFNLPRIAQLGQRSNQFNLTTRRYDEATCKRLMAAVKTSFPFTMTLSDKFGDYGLISVIILDIRDEDLMIDEYLMSCRVLKRGVEAFAMNSIFMLAKQLGKQRVVGRYLPTSKNGMVRDFYAGFGFELAATSPSGETTWTLAIDRYAEQPVSFGEVRDAFIRGTGNGP